MTTTEKNSSPIGIFDSGVGGLSVMEEIHRRFPGESLVYFADSGNCPYGERSRDEILNLSSAIAEFLLGRGCKLIVVACNTITTNIIAELRNRFPVPFIGMEPAIKPAAQHSVTGHIAVLATKGTLEGAMYQKTKSTYASHAEVHNLIGTGLVDLIEADRIDSREMEIALGAIFKSVDSHPIDTLVLGCTHYNFLTEKLHHILGPDVRILNSAAAVARRVGEVLQQLNLVSAGASPSIEIFTTGDRAILRSILARLAIDKASITAIDR